MSATLDALGSFSLAEILRANELIENEERYDWPKHARPKQLPPTGDWQIAMWLAGRGFGKMLDSSTVIPTPSGWTTMGALRPGGRVFDEAGMPCNVLWVSPEQIPDEAYRLTFSDRSSLDACGDHQWVTWTHADRKAFLRSEYEENTSRFPVDWPSWKARRIPASRLSRERVEEALAMQAAGATARQIGSHLRLSRSFIAQHLEAGRYLAPIPVEHKDSPGPRIRLTKEIAKTLLHGHRGDLNHCIPQTAPLVMPEASLLIPPYTFGAWLGDGSSADGTITQHGPDQDSLRFNVGLDGFLFGERKDPQAVSVLGLSPLLRRAGVLHDKHIPIEYLRASVAQRLDLLCGLMDTDGGVEAASTVSFTNTNARLADQVYELIVSLGMRATRDSRQPAMKNSQRAYRITFTPTMQVFRLPRKAARLSFDCGQQLRRHHRMIESTDRIESAPMRCITVDSPNSLYLAGREMIPTHNTRTICEWARGKAFAMPKSRGAIVARVASDVRDVIVEGESGILAISPPDFMPVYEPTKRRLTWPNGTVATLFSADEPKLLRGPNHHWAICDEIAQWGYVEAWKNLKLGLRLGINPQCVIATTPKPCELIRNIMGQAKRSMSVRIVTGTTYENRDNLAPTFFTELISEYEGTRFGRQELDGELLEDTPGALWTQKLIDECRFKGEPADLPQMKRIVIAVDPSVTSKDDSDECGIVAAGLGVDGHGYVLADVSGRMKPRDWACAAIALYEQYNADVIIGEVNNGGDLVEENLRAETEREGGTAVPFRSIHASRGKLIRAQPVSTIYEQKRVHHVGQFKDLEDQLCAMTVDEYTRAGSPDRGDAAVYALTELMLGKGSVQMFPDLRVNHRDSEPEHARHIAEKTELKGWWPCWVSAVTGQDSVAHWWRRSPEGRVYLYRELIVRDSTPEEFGDAIARQSRDEADHLQMVPVWMAEKEFSSAAGKSPAASVYAGINRALGEHRAFLFVHDDRERHIEEQAPRMQAIESRLSKMPRGFLCVQSIRGGKDQAGWDVVRELLRWRARDDEAKPEQPDWQYAKTLAASDMAAYQAYIRQFMDIPVRQLPVLQIAASCKALIQAMTGATRAPKDEEKLTETSSAFILQSLRIGALASREDRGREPMEEFVGRKLDRLGEDATPLSRHLVAKKAEADWGGRFQKPVTFARVRRAPTRLRRAG